MQLGLVVLLSNVKHIIQNNKGKFFSAVFLVV